MPPYYTKHFLYYGGCWLYRARLAHLAAHLFGRFAAHKVQLCPAGASAAQHFYRVYVWRVERKYLFHTHPASNLAHGNHGARLGTMLDSQDQTLKRLATDIFSLHLFFVGRFTYLDFFNFLPYAHGVAGTDAQCRALLDRKSTRLNSSHMSISYA